MRIDVNQTELDVLRNVMGKYLFIEDRFWIIPNFKYKTTTTTRKGKCKYEILNLKLIGWYPQTNEYGVANEAVLKEMITYRLQEINDYHYKAKKIIFSYQKIKEYHDNKQD